MRRRDFIGLLGGASLASRPLSAFGQAPSQQPLIAAQVGGSKTVVDRYFSGFSQGMRERGYVEGHDYRFEIRYADGDVSRIAPQMEELLRLKPDIVVSGTMTGVIAAKKLTDTTPIVSETLTNPIEFGLATSYSRPGGNVTGVMVTVEDLPTKLLALALEVVPGAKKIGLLVHPSNPVQPVFQRSLEVAVNALGIDLTILEIASPDELHAAFQRLARERIKMVLS
jgi:putative ABC transport system substrate-binding protein